MTQFNGKPPKFRRKTFFFLSVFGSIFINLLVLFFITQYHLPGPPQKTETITKTLIVKFKKLSRLIIRKTEKLFKSETQKWKGRKIALSDLAVNVSAINFHPKSKKGQLENRIGKFGDNTGHDIFSIDGYNSIYLFINKTIQKYMDYPEVLVDRGIEGIVQGRLVFTPNGIFLPQFSKLRASNGRLKVHVANTLKELFKSPLPYDLKFNRHDFFMVDTTFRFAIRPYASEEFTRMNSFSNGRHMAILIEKRGFNKHYEGNEWMDLLITAMQYLPAQGNQGNYVEGVLVPLLKGFITEQGPIKLKDGTLQINMSTKDFLVFLKDIFSQKGMIDPKEIRETYHKQQFELENIKNQNHTLNYQDYKNDPEWDEWAEN